MPGFAGDPKSHSHSIAGTQEELSENFTCSGAGPSTGTAVKLARVILKLHADSWTVPLAVAFRSVVVLFPWRTGAVVSTVVGIVVGIVVIIVVTGAVVGTVVISGTPTLTIFSCTCTVFPAEFTEVRVMV